MSQGDAQQRPGAPGASITGGEWRKSAPTDAIDGPIYDLVCFEVERS